MNERWWCLDCRTIVELDTHGRCSACSSNAVDSMERQPLWPRANRPILKSLALDSQFARAI